MSDSDTDVDTDVDLKVQLFPPQFRSKARRIAQIAGRLIEPSAREEAVKLLEECIVEYGIDISQSLADYFADLVGRSNLHELVLQDIDPKVQIQTLETLREKAIQRGESVEYIDRRIAENKSLLESDQNETPN